MAAQGWCSIRRAGCCWQHAYAPRSDGRREGAHPVPTGPGSQPQCPQRRQAHPCALRRGLRACGDRGHDEEGRLRPDSGGPLRDPRHRHRVQPRPGVCGGRQDLHRHRSAPRQADRAHLAARVAPGDHGWARVAIRHRWVGRGAAEGLRGGHELRHGGPVLGGRDHAHRDLQELHLPQRPRPHPRTHQRVDGEPLFCTF